MGRKAKFTEDDRPQKGPGRKAKKQKDPVAPFQIDQSTIKSELHFTYLHVFASSP